MIFRKLLPIYFYLDQPQYDQYSNTIPCTCKIPRCSRFKAFLVRTILQNSYGITLTSTYVFKIQYKIKNN